MLERVKTWKVEFEKKYGAGSCTEIDGTNKEESELAGLINSAISPSLFSSKKLLLCRNCLPIKAGQEDLAKAILGAINAPSPDVHSVFYNTKKPDKRLSLVKSILNSGAELVDFEVPTGAMLQAWIKRRAALKGASIDDGALVKFMDFLGADTGSRPNYQANGEPYDLWQADNEMNKLVAYSSRISTKNVELLFKPYTPTNIFSIADGMVKGNIEGALKAAEDLFDSESADDKGVAIKIVGMLAQQFKSMLLVNLLSKNKMDTSSIARLLDWSPQRASAVSRSAASFSEQQSRAVLSELSQTDIKLKSTDQNPRLMIAELIRKNKR